MVMPHGPLAGPGIPEQWGTICDYKALGTTLHGDDGRPRARWNTDGAKGEEAVCYASEMGSMRQLKTSI